jgi:ABC-type branched-subunit amino acid transport system ATPase component
MPSVYHSCRIASANSAPTCARVAAPSGVLAVLLVEQTVRGSLAIADRAYFLERGAVVTFGTAGALAADERILNSYLGVA